MENAFAQRVEAWHDFYLLVGTASATLVGLLFIALTLNPEAALSEESGGSRTLARQSFACFINLLIISGVMLIPQQSLGGVGIPLVSIGVLSLGFTFRSMVGRWRRGEWRNIGGILRHTALLLIGMGSLVGIGLALWAGDGGMLTWLTATVLTLLSAASHNAWALIVTPRVTQSEPTRGGNNG